MLRHRCGSQGNAVDQRVNRQTKAESSPAEVQIAVMMIAVHVVVVAVFVTQFFLFVMVFGVDGQIVLMKMEQPTHEEHKQ